MQGTPISNAGLFAGYGFSGVWTSERETGWDAGLALSAEAGVVQGGAASIAVTDVGAPIETSFNVGIPLLGFDFGARFGLEGVVSWQSDGDGLL